MRNEKKLATAKQIIRTKHLVLKLNNGTIVTLDELATQTFTAEMLAEIAMELATRKLAIEKVEEDLELSLTTILSVKNKNRGVAVWYEVVLHEIELRTLVETEKTKAAKALKLKAELVEIEKLAFETMSTEDKKAYYAAEAEKRKTALKDLDGEISESDELIY